MTWTLYKEIKYATNGIPAENLTGYPKLVSISADADIASECGGGGGIKFTSADGLTDLPFGVYPSNDVTSGDILARVKVNLSTSASVGDVICRLYYSSTETTTEDKAGTVSADYLVFMPLEEDPSGSAPQMYDWVSETNIGTSEGSMTTGDLVSGIVGDSLDFDGTDDAISIGVIEPTKITIETWCSGMPNTVECQILTRDEITDRCWQFRRNAANFLQFIVWNQAGTLATETGSTAFHGGTIADAHCAGTWDGSTINVYLNGSKDGSGTSLTGTSVDTSGSAVTKIGARGYGSGSGWWAGQQDEVKISNVARSENWLAYVYQDEGANGDTFTLSTEQSSGGSSVSAGVGSYSLSGTAASLLKGWLISAGGGSLTLTGTAATLLKGYTLTAGSGSYAISGTAAALTKQWTITASAGSYTLSGMDAMLSTSARLTAEVGSYSLSGTAATLTKQWTIAAAAGSYTLTGTAATLTHGFNVTVQSGSYAITGTSAALKKQWKISAAAGSYTLTGTSATLSVGGNTVDGAGFVVAAQVYHPGPKASQIYFPGPKAAQVTD